VRSFISLTLLPINGPINIYNSPDLKTWTTESGIAPGSIELDLSISLPPGAIFDVELSNEAGNRYLIGPYRYSITRGISP
jgi:hypothetical protein